jgi:hypothetical protein
MDDVLSIQGCSKKILPNYLSSSFCAIIRKEKGNCKSEAKYFESERDTDFVSFPKRVRVRLHTQPDTPPRCIGRGEVKLCGPRGTLTRGTVGKERVVQTMMTRMEDRNIHKHEAIAERSVASMCIYVDDKATGRGVGMV